MATTTTTTPQSTAAKKAAATRRRNAAKRSAAAKKAAATRAAANRTPVEQVQETAERVVLIPVGAALTARDRVVGAVGELVDDLLRPGDRLEAAQGEPEAHRERPQEVRASRPHGSQQARARPQAHAHACRARAPSAPHPRAAARQAQPHEDRARGQGPAQGGPQRPHEGPHDAARRVSTQVADRRPAGRRRPARSSSPTSRSGLRTSPSAQLHPDRDRRAWTPGRSVGRSSSGRQSSSASYPAGEQHPLLPQPPGRLARGASTVFKRAVLPQ